MGGGFFLELVGETGDGWLRFGWAPDVASPVFAWVKARVDLGPSVSALDEMLNKDPRQDVFRRTLAAVLRKGQLRRHS